MSQTGENLGHQISSEQITKHDANSETTNPEINLEPTKDFFVTYKRNVDKYFENLENSIPKFYQTIHELHQEYLQLWENMVNATISIQKEFVNKAEIKGVQSPAAKDFVSDLIESANKARTVRDQIFLKSIETAKDNVNAWNNHSHQFAETNAKMVQFWTSLFMAGKT